ncbi:MAG: histidine phosphatase family protein [Actinomycetota bacterium]
MIVFARHGRTEVNRGGRLQGRIDAPLDELGRRQAEAIAAALVAEAPVRVVASPLARARATAAAVAAAAGLEVEVDERLVEIDYGAWDGVPMADIPPEAWAQWHADPDFAPPGGESLRAVGARVTAFCTEVLAAGPGPVVAVTHVSPIKLAVCAALGADTLASWRMFCSVASVTRIGARPDGAPVLLGFNDTAHLAALGHPGEPSR